MSGKLARFFASIIIIGLVGTFSYLVFFTSNPVQIAFAYHDSGIADNPDCDLCCSSCSTRGNLPADTPNYYVSATYALSGDSPPGIYHFPDGSSFTWGPNDGGGDDDDDDGGIIGIQPGPTCTVDLVPASSTISIGSSSPLVVSFSESTGTIDEVHFSSDNGSTTISPAADTDSAYGTTATGASLGSSTITATVHMTTPDNSHKAPCSDTATVTVTNPPGWWQTKDADVWSRGDLTSIIPGTCTGACVNNFSLDGTGGFPGVVVYNGSSNFGSGSVSSKNWQANSGYAGTAYNYNWFESKIPSDVTINTIPDSSVNGGYFSSNGTPSQGYVWFKRTGDLTISSQVNLNNRKVVLFVTGNLTINGRVNFDDGTGFFMTIVGGNINIDRGVSHPNLPALEGAYFAGGDISTGTGGTSTDSQLYIRGSIVANGSINLQRDLGDDNKTKPAEYIEFAPDLIFTYPKGLGLSNFIWHEIAP